ncbi:DUF389 domain-containing protein [Chlorobium phaeovibrioides]|uniref:DUF389 domain-containing protein n=2 Tax=Chlorobium phaeovibrioides TaxID=1094 RepID=A0A3S0L718_CHLPH|nr:DUF389 domain-containing protein [Chlorobium phaeovibrioides]RTY39956.1 DUF389 domain-containing protein [Chlorobium phaeovibrioides]HCD35437.1 DUF389 domain-containing protein [Chlorobium sp.]
MPTNTNLIRLLLSSLSIHNDAEKFDAIHKAVESDIEFRGSRLWILIFAILLASVGLNINSTAVIIGAMLISPLMGPINGMGYSIATYNFPLLRKAFKNYSFAVFASLAASTIYFAISPVSIAHSELLARTSPTIYDVMIALFGGLAGTLSLTTKLKGNVVPGVAIATALMPPLCTAGYGLATGQFFFFFGALYLFTINTVFIALSTVAFSQVMKFPLRSSINEDRRAVINRWITIVILFTLIPSIYFGYLLVQKERFTENAGKLARSVSLYNGEYLLRHDIDADSKIITLVYGGRKLTDEDKSGIKKRAVEFGLEKATITFEQGISFSDFSSEITAKITESDQMKAEVNRLSLALQDNARREDSLRTRSYTGRVLLKEMQPLFPQVTACLYGESYRFAAKQPGSPQKVAFVHMTTSRKLAPAEKKKITAWLKVRLEDNGVTVVFE